MAEQSSKTVVWIGLAADALVAAAKFAAALFTGSASIAASSIQSLVSAGSGGLMLYGFRRAQRGPDPRHPPGHGRELYFWSFIVAQLFFTLGAGFSIYEGVRHILGPSVVQSPLVIYLVLGADALFSAVSWTFALRSFRKAKGEAGYWEAMKASKDPPNFIVLAEDTAELVGVAVTAAGTFAATHFHIRLADGSASVLIGLIVAVVGLILVRESKGLLIGEQAGRRLSSSIIALSEDERGIEGANGVVATQFAPDQVLVALSLEFDDELRTPEIETAVRQVEARIREKHPEVVALFVKPQSRKGFRTREDGVAFADPTEDEGPEDPDRE